MIEIRLRRDEDAPRSPTKGSAWIAESTIDGQVYAARSRNGASYELARQLVAAGVPDQPVRLAEYGASGWSTCRSLHAYATRTIAESATRAIGVVKWHPHPNASECDTGPARSAVDPFPGSSVLSGSEGHKIAIPASVE